MSPRFHWPRPGWFRPRSTAPVQVQERPSHLLQMFLVELGGALVSTGTAVSDIKRTLTRIAVALGSPGAVVVVFPTAVFVAVPGETETHFDISDASGDGLRFDRADRIYALVDRAVRGEITAAEGIDELRAIHELTARFSWPLRILGHGLIATGVSAVLIGASLTTMILAFALGLLVGWMKLLARQGSSAAILLPVLTSLLIALASFTAAHFGVVQEPLGLLIPAIVTLLPGGTLTISVQELAAGDMLAGASRLVYGVAQLVFLAFGIIAASLIATALFSGVPASFELRPTTGVAGALTPWIGILIMALGFFLYFCGLRFSFFYLAGMLLLAYAVQLFGQSLGGSLLSGFLAALVLTVAAYIVQTLPGAPPAVVCFLPAFWLLVPGASGLIGLTQTAAGTFSTNDVATIAGSLVTIALGVLSGLAVYRGIYRIAPNRWRLRLS